MQSGSYWAYREAGAFDQEHDDNEPERRTRCTCGAFLPGKPTFEGGLMKVTRDFGGETLQGRWVPDEQEVEEWFDPSTDCRKCGRVWLEAELWK